jgi:hypothetical protein
VHRARPHAWLSLAAITNICAGIFVTPEETMEAMAAKVLGPRDGKFGFLGSIGVRFMIDGSQSNGGFSLVEHPMSSRALAAPLHRHTREDEYSFVLEGQVGAPRWLYQTLTHLPAGKPS